MELRSKITVIKPQTEEEHTASKQALVSLISEFAKEKMDITWNDEENQRMYDAQVVVMSLNEWVEIEDKLKLLDKQK